MITCLQAPLEKTTIPLAPTADSKKLEHGCRMVDAGFPSPLGLVLEHRHVPTFWVIAPNGP